MVKAQVQTDTKKISIGEESFEFLNSGCIITREEPVVEYASDYLDTYLNLAETEMGAAISKFRKEFTENYVSRVEGDIKILDYGCGAGVIIQKDERDQWRGYDINDMVADLLGDKFDPDPDLSEYSAICFFDSLEHLPQPEELLDTVLPGSLVVVTIPIAPPAYFMDLVKPVGRLTRTPGLYKWKHFKPGEHLMYCSEKGFVKFMESQGFDHIGLSDEEIVLGREDIHTFAFIKL